MTSQNINGKRVDFVIDGSNVLLSNFVDKKPSVRAFVALLNALEKHGKTFKVWFDKSIYHHIRDKGGDIEMFEDLVRVLNAHSMLEQMQRADIGIQKDCQFFNAAVINGGDNNDSWRAPVPVIFRCRLNVMFNRDLMVYVAPAGGGAKLFSESVNDAFKFKEMNFNSLAPNSTPPEAGTFWVQQSKFKGRRPHGNLLVLALDASPSMDEVDTYDGRSRATHVNEILRATIDGLSDSSIASNLYICVLSFSSDVVLHTANDSGYVFSSLHDWQKAPLTNYLTGVSREGTNIRLALDRSADYIDGFRQSDESKQLATNWKNATVVVLTDGDHQVWVGEEVERSADIINHVFAAISRSENVSFGFLGLGDGADFESLHGWSSEASPLQIDLARRKEVQLNGGRLCVKANNKDAKLQNVVRSFIDVASSRAI